MTTTKEYWLERDEEARFSRAGFIIFTIIGIAGGIGLGIGLANPTPTGKMTPVAIYLPAPATTTTIG